MQLKNSIRLLFTASYVNTKLIDEDRRVVESGPTGAFRKLSMLETIGIALGDLPKLRRVLDSNDRVDAASRDKLIDVMALLAGGRTPRLELAKKSAEVPASAIQEIVYAAQEAGLSSPMVDALAPYMIHEMGLSPIGRLYLERIEMYPIGVQRGELVFTVPLAPGETQTISHKEWSTSSREYEELVQDYFESYSERGVAEKTDVSMVTENEATHSNTLNFGATLSGGYGPVSLTTTMGFTTANQERASVQQSMQRNKEVTEKASARARKEHKISVKLETKSGVEDSSFQTITNPTNNARRIDYYRMMRKWRTDLFRYGLRMTYDFALPAPGIRLWAQWRKLAEYDEKLKRPFVFAMKPADITDANWLTHATTFNVVLEAPLDPSITLLISRTFEAHKDGDSVFEFVAPPGYEVGNQAKFLIQYSGPSGVPSILMSSQSPMAGHVTAPGTGIFEGGVTGIGGGERSAVTIRADLNFRMQMVVQTNAKRRADAHSAWQLRCWEVLKNAAFASYQAEMGKIREERDILHRQLIGKDTLSLRRLEREEIIRMTLLWLFGGYPLTMAPGNIEDIVAKLLGNETAHLDPTFNPGPPTLDGIGGTSAWSEALRFGEMIKFLQQAIEWENLLYFFYPYFWGSETQSRDRLLFEHPDPEHQNFLRAGYSRVVITVRPGFEKDLTELLETGTFGSGYSSPYISIAEEIANFAKTNYAGIPPANPELHARPQLYPQQRETWETMQRVIQALELYKSSNGQYPPDLASLSSSVDTRDAWGNEFIYLIPGTGNEYDLISYGADGKEGGEGPDADISAGAGASLMATWFDYTPTSGIDIEVDTKADDIA